MYYNDYVELIVTEAFKELKSCVRKKMKLWQKADLIEPLHEREKSKKLTRPQSKRETGIKPKKFAAIMKRENVKATLIFFH